MGWLEMGNKQYFNLGLTKTMFSFNLILISFNNFQRYDVTTILIGLNNFKNLLHFVMKKKKLFVGHLYGVNDGTTF